MRLSLDLAFFSPFPDGNARAARLGFEFCLRRGGLPMPPGDAERYVRFVRLVARSLSGSARCEEAS